MESIKINRSRVNIKRNNNQIYARCIWYSDFVLWSPHRTLRGWTRAPKRKETLYSYEIRQPMKNETKRKLWISSPNNECVPLLLIKYVSFFHVHSEPLPNWTRHANKSDWIIKQTDNANSIWDVKCRENIGEHLTKLKLNCVARPQRWTNRKTMDCSANVD